MLLAVEYLQQLLSSQQYAPSFLCELAHHEAVETSPVQRQYACCVDEILADPGDMSHESAWKSHDGQQICDWDRHGADGVITFG